MLDAYKNLTNAIVKRVNNTVRPENKTLEILAPKKIRKEFVNLVGFGVQSGFLLSAVSEVSVRLQRDFLLTHKPGSLLLNLQEEDLMYYSVKEGLTQKNHAPPGHLDWHQFIYQNVEANTVVLAHPFNLFNHISKISKADGEKHFRTFNFQPGLKTSTIEKALDLFVHHSFILVQGHCLVAWGSRLDDVLANIEYLDWLCSFDLV